MAEQKIIQDPKKNAYQVGIAYRLKVDPRRVNCIFRMNPEGGGFLIDVAVDGRDLNPTEAEIVRQYFEEEMYGAPSKVVGERDINSV